MSGPSSVVLAFDGTDPTYFAPAVETAKSLGTAKIDLSDLEPFESVEKVIPLSHVKHGAKGSIRVRLVFQPAIIARSRKVRYPFPHSTTRHELTPFSSLLLQNTSTFSTVGRAAGQVGGIPLGVASGVGKGVFHGVVGVGHGVGSVGGFAGRKIGLVKKKDKSGNEVVSPSSLEVSTFFPPFEADFLTFFWFSARRGKRRIRSSFRSNLESRRRISRLERLRFEGKRILFARRIVGCHRSRSQGSC